MLATELLLAMLAFERQEIDEVAVFCEALVSNGEESSRFRGRSHGCGVGIRVRRQTMVRPSQLIYALANVDAQASAHQARSENTAAETEEGSGRD